MRYDIYAELARRTIVFFIDWFDSHDEVLHCFHYKIYLQQSSRHKTRHEWYQTIWTEWDSATQRKWEWTMMMMKMMIHMYFLLLFIRRIIWEQTKQPKSRLALISTNNKWIMKINPTKQTEWEWKQANLCILNEILTVQIGRGVVGRIRSPICTNTHTLWVSEWVMKRCYKYWRQKCERDMIGGG